MRRLAVIIGLLAMMLGLDALKASTLPGKNPMTLAAIGFVLLAAFTVAEIGSLLRLPKVTGYIVSGVVLGPSVADILSTQVVTEMKMFNTLALGLIATGAGLELDLRQIGRLYKTLATTIVSKVLIGAAVVGGTFYLIQTTTGVLPLDGRSQVLAVTLVLAALSVGTSPAIALAVMNETRARGRLMDLVLGHAVLKDLVVVVLLAVAVAASRSLIGQAGGDENVILLVAEELGSSILAGLVLGALLIAYIRFVHAEMLLFVAAMILVVSEVGRALHLELLLVFITAGFVVRNFSKYEHELMGPVQMVALPVFVVFFTNAGAGIDLSATWRILPLAAALCAARAVVYVMASRIGGRVGGESEYVRKNAWLGYLPQAGVTLGLVGLAAQQLPSLASQITSTGMAVVALNLLVGPITLRRALKGAGEVAEEGAEEHSAPAAVATELALAEPPPEEAERLAELADRLGQPELAAIVAELYQKLWARSESIVREPLESWQQTLTQTQHELLADDDWTLRLEAWAIDARSEDMERRVELSRALFEALADEVRACPAVVTVPMTADDRRVYSGDSWRVRLRKRGATLARVFTFGKSGRLRRVPVGLVARHELEPRVARLALELLGVWCRTQAHVVEELRRLAEKKHDLETTRRTVSEELDAVHDRFEAQAKTLLLDGLSTMVDPLRLAGGPALPPRKLRLSAVEPQVAGALAELDARAEAWAHVLEADRGALLLQVELAHMEARLSASLEQTVLEPAAHALENIEAVVDTVRFKLETIRDTLPPERPLSDGERGGFVDRCALACDEDLTRQLERGAARLRAAASAHSVAVEARAVIERLPETLVLARADTPAFRAAEPDHVQTRRVPLRSEASELVIRRLLPGIDEQVRTITEIVAATAGRIREAIDIAQHALEAHGSEDGSEEREMTKDAFDRALSRLAEHLQALDDGIQKSSEGIRTQARTALDDLARLGESEESARAAAGGLLSRWIQRARRATAPGAEWLHAGLERLSRIVDRVSGSQISRDVRRRVTEEAFDAADIRDYAERWQRTGELPKDYQKLFLLEPVREHRLFSAYEAELRSILAAERDWLGGAASSALLVGSHGSGRTSMLNLCELELSAPRLLRPEPLEWRRDVGIVEALSIELGVRPRRSALIAALSETKTTILLDDLEQWFPADVKGLRELEGFLDLVVATRKVAFWLVAAEASTLSLFEECVSVRESFAKVVSLEPLGTEALASAIEQRHRLSGRKVVYPRTVASRVLARLQRADDRSLYFSVLARVSDGNLSRAFAIWLKSIGVDTTGNVAPEVHRTLSLTLPFLDRLPPPVAAMLLEMMRFGPMEEADLAKSLQLGPAEARRHLHFLTTSGLVEPIGTGRGEVRIVRAVRPLVLQGLRSMGVRS
ncbi:MAG: cation:proton antiporter [Myxococcales bacterium]|nr:cation:proton antiporter [Myxococcales bacterium]MCB9578581.1 cation:proton antiporter [Polyangiaceae bacterium]